MAAARFTAEILEDVLARLREGETLQSISESPGYPSPGTMINWCRENPLGPKVSPPMPDWRARFRDAQNEGYEVQAQELAHMARTELNAENAHAIRVKADIFKWLLSKRLPKEYGERTVIAGDPDAPLAVVQEMRPPVKDFLLEFRRGPVRTLEAPKSDESASS